MRSAWELVKYLGGSTIIKGVRYLFDVQGTPQAVMIDLRKHRRLWEDFQDLLVARQHRKEPRVTLAEIKKRFQRNGKAI